MKLNKTFIVAEIGNNHEGSYLNAKKMIILAKKAGVDAVKFQTFLVEDFINPTLKKSFNRLKKFQLSIKEFKNLKVIAKKLKIKFLSTPLDARSLKNISSSLDIIKIASSDNNFYHLIELAIKTKKEVIISLGLCACQIRSPQVSFVELHRFDSPQRTYVQFGINQFHLPQMRLHF